MEVRVQQFANAALKKARTPAFYLLFNNTTNLQGSVLILCLHSMLIGILVCFRVIIESIQKLWRQHKSKARKQKMDEANSATSVTITSAETLAKNSTQCNNPNSKVVQTNICTLTFVMQKIMTMINLFCQIKARCIITQG